MVEINTQNLDKAIAKARQTKPLVKVIEFRLYQVTNKITGATYTVKFSKVNNTKYAECNCKATKVCYHIGAAVGIHIVLAAQTVSA
jgi:glutamate formiminotransferase